MKRILGITFDLDDTLYDNRPVLERAERVLHDWLARHYPRLVERFDVQGLRGLRHAVAQANPHLSHDLTVIRKMALGQAAEQSGYSHHLVEPAFQVFHRARNQVQMYPDVVPALQGLRERYVLGTLTNGNADLGQLGLSPLFEFAISAAEVGAAKPEPQMFLEAARQVGTTPARLVHVGDDPIRDVAGAAAVGLGTVWVNRPADDWPGGRRPDAEVSSLSELPGVLAKMG